MTRIVGHMVVRNELQRYLPDTLGWLQKEITPEVVVYDDQSDDGTFEFLEASSVTAIARRPDNVPSFAENESGFRRAAWEFLESAVRPKIGDWILVIDADEFLVLDHRGQLLDRIETTIDACLASGYRAVNFTVREVFGIDGISPMIRKDQYWDRIRACRLVRWGPDAQFLPVPEGGGSVPNNWQNWRFYAEDLSLLHYGYAREQDRQAKFDRYRTSPFGGHNPTHIASILRPGKLVPWTGQRPVL